MQFSVAEAIATDTESVSPDQVVHNLQTSLLQAMREGEQLDYQGRFEFLSPVINQTHDIDLIIKTILGATLWFEMGVEQQTLLTDTFQKLSIATYAGRFFKYDGEQFEISEQQELPRDQVLVRSRLIKGDGDSVNFDYVLRQSKGQWRIVNILFDGVSDLAIKRSEYRAVLQRDGFSVLIEILEEKIILAQQN
ncbi:MAG: ABC transporter substrate-binding protein [Betaproteobacteria bacterium]|nr:ABC transporter substrate-binding protein [Betaproteobacteria bacterium]